MFIRDISLSPLRLSLLLFTRYCTPRSLTLSLFQAHSIVPDRRSLTRTRPPFNILLRSRPHHSEKLAAAQRVQPVERRQQRTREREETMLRPALALHSERRAKQRRHSIRRSVEFVSLRARCAEPQKGPRVVEAGLVPPTVQDQDPAQQLALLKKGKADLTRLLQHRPRFVNLLRHA
eukprot:1807958-Pleurochrysis_carterae.AAC.1